MSVLGAATLLLPVLMANTSWAIPAPHARLTKIVDMRRALLWPAQTGITLSLLDAIVRSALEGISALAESRRSVRIILIPMKVRPHAPSLKN